ncbi:hypothetical protein H4R24_002964 [Coemansia sp. RSA 988]|nr:hypothetical protein H4R24_002964 [Coemansia sp. RSA 988]
MGKSHRANGAACSDAVPGTNESSASVSRAPETSAQSLPTARTRVPPSVTMPPSYDDVMSSTREELVVGYVQREGAQTSTSASPFTPVDEVGPFSASNIPEQAIQDIGIDTSVSQETQPLMSTYVQQQVQQDQERDMRTADPYMLSSRDFFASLEYKRSSNGYSSSDPWLNTNARALRRFISETNERPRVSIEVTGSHKEVKTDEYGMRRDRNDQNIHQSSSSNAETVVDFKFTMQLTPFIHKQGSLHTARAPNGEPYEIDKVLEDYVAAENMLKEIKVQKKAIWDYDLVRQKIVEFIRTAVEYPHIVTVDFPMEGDHTIVKTNNKIGRLWRHPATNLLCLVSCVCLVGWPLKYFAVKRWRNKVMSDFVVMIPPQQFVENHKDFIRSQVSW